MQLPQLVHKLYSDGLFARPSFAAPELLAPLKFEKAAAAEQNVAVSQVAAIKRSLSPRNSAVTKSCSF